jgi:hypothetical protein
LSARVSIVAIVVFALFSGPAFAQGVSGGIKVGVGFAKLTADNEDDVPLETRRGILVGGFVDVPVHDYLSIVIEALFAQKGGQDSGDGSVLTTQLDYLEFPVLVNVPFDTMTAVRPFVYAGIAPAFKTSAVFKAEFVGEEAELDIDDEFAAADVGLVFGGGVRFGMVAVEGRYNQGLLNISDIDTADSIKNRQAAVLVSIRFGTQ